MFAMTFDAGRDFLWREVADPVRKDDELLIEIRAAALNRADLLQRAGKYPPPPGWPEWPGLEASGIVLEAPAGSRFAPGARVCALLGGGGYAERVAAPEGQALPMPKGYSFVEAASLPEAFATAYLNLVWEAGLRAGETVLIHAAASGVGLAAAQTAKFLGAKVVAVAGSPEKAEAVRALGADVPVNRRVDDLEAILAAHPVDVALDCVGGGGLGRGLSAMRPGGRWVLISTLGGETAEIPLRIVLKQGLRLIGSTLRGRSPEAKAKLLAEMEVRLWPALERRDIRPTVHSVLPMAEAGAAHGILERGENIGKVVLTLEN